MNDSSLRGLYLQHQGKVSDKWALYLETYNEVFASYRDQSIRLFEIGVQNGGSLDIWARYFANAQLLIGCDIDEKCRMLDYEDQRIQLIVGDANTDVVQTEILARCPNFDIILDDGSHTSGDIVLSFARYFPHLTEGGVYVAEDLHCSYWKGYQGGLFDPTSSISFFKRLADVINFEHWGVPGQRADILRAFEQEYGRSLDHIDLAHIYSVEFRNSLCIIRKRTQKATTLGPRVIAGSNADVASAPAALNGLLLSQAYLADESKNEWSDLRHLPEVELANLRKERKLLQDLLRELEEKSLEQDSERQSLHSGINAVRTQLEAVELSQAQLEMQLVDAQNALRQAETVLAQRSNELSRTSDALALSEASHAALLSSRSWRLVSALRKLANRIRMIGRPASALPAGPSIAARLRVMSNHKRDLVRIFAGPLRKRDAVDFDAQWYRDIYPDVGRSGASPLAHYLRFGLFEGRAPNAYAAQFDQQWYRATYPDLAGCRDTFAHFVRQGAADGRFPNSNLQHFDARWYLKSYPDVTAFGQPAILHYLRYGVYEGRLPCAGAIAQDNSQPPNSTATTKVQVAKLKAPLFDDEWYFETYPDVIDYEGGAWAHFLNHGAAEGRSPNASLQSFDGGWYLATYPDVAASGELAILHFLEHGSTEGRLTRAPSSQPAIVSPAAREMSLRLLAAGEIGAAAMLDLAREGQLQAANKFAPVRPLNVGFDLNRGTATLWIVLPSVRKRDATGGPNTAYILAVLLAQHGIPVGFISSDAPPDQDLTAISDHLYALTGARPEDLAIQFADASNPNELLQLGPNDVLMATAWWTAHAAHAALPRTHNNRLYYLIQDYEPLFYGASENWSQALETYSFQHVPLINTTLLRDFLSDMKIGRFADKEFADEALVFEPAVDRTHFFAETRPVDMPKRLLFYARPTIAQRNLFGMGVAALKAAVTAGLFGDGGWEFIGIGEKFDPVELGRGYVLSPAPWLDFMSYATQMRSADLLLSLMLSPHPSYPPLEMAACNGIVVTTTYGSKTSDRLAALSSNIIGVKPTIGSLVWGLQRAIRRRDDRGAPATPLALPLSWPQSMAAILPRLLDELARDGVVPLERATSLAPAHTSSALALYGDQGDFYRKRQRESHDLFRRGDSPALLSLITTVYDTDASQLTDLAHSLFGQDTKIDFEWVLLDNGSTNVETLAILERLRAHPQVRYGRVDSNLGIIRGMRWCLEQARGRYIVPVDSDDILFPQCLRVVSAFIEQAGFPAILYTDEDKTDGERNLHLYAKPDWDPVLFIHSCFIAHLTAIDRVRALELDCYSDSGANGSHDWDTFIRFLVNGHTPIHLPEPLYTWRMHPGSTSGNIGSKNYIYESHRNVLQNFLRGRSLDSRYQVDLSPLFGGAPDWRFTPLSDESSPQVASIEIGPSSDRNIVVAILDAVSALPSATAHIHLWSSDCTVLGSEWAVEATTLMEFFPDTVMVGGRIHDGSTIQQAGYVFGYGGFVGCPDIGRSLGDPGYFAQLWKPRSVGAVSARHCVVSRDFLISSLSQIPSDVDVETLGLWLGAYARAQSARVVFTPFLEAKVSSGHHAHNPGQNLELLIARFGHLAQDHCGYSPRLDRSGARPYEPGDAVASYDRPSYGRFLSDRLERRQTPHSLQQGNISLLTTVYQRTNTALFLQTVDSVLGQTTRPIEWIVLAHGPVPGDLSGVLAELSDKGSIRLLRLPENIGIAGGLRYCLERASADFAMSLDADDLLEKDAVALLLNAFNRHPDAHVVYSDEDLWIQESACHPYRRPDFDPALLCAHSYVWHAIAFKRETGLALGAFTDREAEYAQDWDLLLRFMWAGHIPVHTAEVLYHWRQHESSLSHSGNVFEGSLSSIRYLLADVAAHTGQPHRYEVRPYPYRIGEIDYYLRRLPIEAPAVFRMDIGSRMGCAVFHDSRTDIGPSFHFASQSTIACNRGGAGLAALESVVESSDSELVLLLGAGITLMDAEGLWQAIKQLELVPQALGVGGPLVSVGGLVRFGPVVETSFRQLADPSLGKALTNAGPFSLALKPHCVTAVTPDLFLARREPLLRALRTAPAELTLRGLGAWLGMFCREHGQYLIYEPLFCAGVDTESALVGDSLEGLRHHWQWLRPYASNHPIPVRGLSGFIEGATQHE